MATAPMEIVLFLISYVKCFYKQKATRLLGKYPKDTGKKEGRKWVMLSFAEILAWNYRFSKF